MFYLGVGGYLKYQFFVILIGGYLKFRKNENILTLPEEHQEPK